MLQDFYGRNRLMAVIIWKSDNVWQNKVNAQAFLEGNI